MLVLELEVSLWDSLDVMEFELSEAIFLVTSCRCFFSLISATTDLNWWSLRNMDCFRIRRGFFFFGLLVISMVWLRFLRRLSINLLFFLTNSVKYT